MENEKECSDETITLDEPIIFIDTSSKDESIKMKKCCSECNCTGYEMDYDNICICGHNSEKHSC